MRDSNKEKTPHITPENIISLNTGIFSRGYQPRIMFTIMKIPEELKSRIFTNKFVIKYAPAKIILNAMLKGTVVEMIYEFDEGNQYIEIAPICLKEVEGKWYLIGSHKDSSITLFSLEKMIQISDHYITFGLPENMDYDKFMEKYFNLSKVV